MAKCDKSNPHFVLYKNARSIHLRRTAVSLIIICVLQKWFINMALLFYIMHLRSVGINAQMGPNNVYFESYERKTIEFVHMKSHFLINNIVFPQFSWIQITNFAYRLIHCLFAWSETSHTSLIWAHFIQTIIHHGSLKLCDNNSHCAQWKMATDNKCMNYCRPAKMFDKIWHGWRFFGGLGSGPNTRQICSLAEDNKWLRENENGNGTKTRK